MDERPKYKMRFVGFKEDGSGELKPTSPGGIKRHEIQMLPIEYAKDIWWELVDTVPEFVLPEPKFEESVFIDQVFVPTDEPLSDIPRINDFDTNKLLGDKITIVKEPAPSVDTVLYEKMTVKSLKLFIKQRGGKVNSKWLRADLVREARILEETSRAT